MKIYALSDIHADYQENLDWLLSLSETDYRDDVLILAGDVSHDMGALRRVFQILSSRFNSVTYVPGNHELWVHGVDDDEFDCSLEKFRAIQALCSEHDIATEVSHFGRLSIVPLLGWYDFSFGEPDRHLRRAWRDFRACRWPDNLADDGAIAEYFLEQNRDRLTTRNEVLISFSHFLPRIDVMPARIPLERRRVYPVLGSAALGEQVKQLNPDIHVYGHSHVNQSIELDAIHYVNNAFAYPGEQRIARKRLHCVMELAEPNHAVT